MADVESAVDDVMEQVSEVGDDMEKFTQAESAEFYEEVASSCSMRAELIRTEMGTGG